MLSQQYSLCREVYNIYFLTNPTFFNHFVIFHLKLSPCIIWKQNKCHLKPYYYSHLLVLSPQRGFCTDAPSLVDCLTTYILKLKKVSCRGLMKIDQWKKMLWLERHPVITRVITNYWIAWTNQEIIDHEGFSRGKQLVFMILGSTCYSLCWEISAVKLWFFLF